MVIGTDTASMYRTRFGADANFRAGMWKTLCQSFFQDYVPEGASVMEFGAGYCEFINNIAARKKAALDINPDVAKYAGKNVKAMVGSSAGRINWPQNSLDAVFASNFFEHLEREDIVRTICNARLLLKKGGRLLILQPSFRFCAKDYYMFFDHVTPIDDRGLCELLRSEGFGIEKCIPRFLPFTTKGVLPSSLLLLRIYLAFPPLWRVFGQQSFIYARKK